MSAVLRGALSGGRPRGLDFAVGVGDRERAVGVELQTPAAFMSEVVMFAAQRQQVGEIGRATVLPIEDMVRLGEFVGNATTRHRTCWVHRPQRPPLSTGGKTC